MTIIVAYKGMMAADSYAFAGGRCFPCGDPKIRRTLDGGLVACCGSEDDCYVFASWAADGFKPDEKPTLTQPPDGFRAIYMDPSGAICQYYSTDRAHPIAEPAVIGEHAACAVAMGALSFGASAAQAVKVAIENCVWVGGPIQVETVGCSAAELAAKVQ